MDFIKRMEHFKVPGMSATVIDNGKIIETKTEGILEKGDKKNVDSSSIFHACSMSKMITAICVLRLSQENKLDLTKNVNEYLSTWKIPDNEFTVNTKVTLSNLLAHQAGFYDVDGSFGHYQKGDNVPSNLDILRGVTKYNPEKLEVKYEPETDFCYSDAGYVVIHQVLNDVFGKSIAQIAQELIFDPLKLKNIFFWKVGEIFLKNDLDVNLVAGHDSDGNLVPEIRASYVNVEGAALWSTTNDLAKILIDMMESLDGNGIILNKETTQKMITPFGCDEAAGLGIFLDYDENGEKYFMSQGWGIGMQSKLRAYPQRKKGVVVMTNSEPGIEQDLSLVGEVINHFMNQY